MGNSNIKYLVIPCYKNVPQIFFIKLLQTKEEAITYTENVNEQLITQINTRIENNENMENEQKAYDFMMVTDNISIFIVGVNDEGKSNKLYQIKTNPRNNKKTLETITITGNAELPQIKTFDYMKKPRNIPFEN